MGDTGFRRRARCCRAAGWWAAGDGRRPQHRRLPSRPGTQAGALLGGADGRGAIRSEEHTSELQSLMRISYAVFCLKKKHKIQKQISRTYNCITMNANHIEQANIQYKRKTRVYEN